MRVILMGPPGAGKGTQAKLLSAALQVPHISTGELFRGQIALGTPLGLEAARFINQGEYVPDSVTNGMLESRLDHEDVQVGFLLDGYPRTLPQISALDEMLEVNALGIDHVVELTVDIEAVVQRLLKRAVEQGRADDSEQVIRHRMKVYYELTDPIAGVYAQRGLLRQVDGMGSVEDVTPRILAALGA